MIFKAGFTTKISIFAIFMIVLTQNCSGFDVKGINFVSVPYTRAKYSTIYARESLEHLKSTGANWISIPITFWQDGLSSSEMKPIYARLANIDRIIETPTDKEINDAILMAKKLGLKVMLVPRLDLNVRSWHDLSNIGRYYSPYQAIRFFKYWTKNVLKIAELAETTGAEMICVGNNFRFMAMYQKYWDELIDEVRKVFKGKLTYSASLNDEFKKTGFWKKLDYIGLMADLNLNITSSTQKEEVDAEMAKFVKKANYVHKIWKKDVIVTRAFAHSPADIDKFGRVYKIYHDSQKNFYNGVFDAIKNLDYVKGIFWGDWAADSRVGGEKDTGVTPQYKGTEMILREHYGGDLDVPEMKQGYGEYDAQRRMFCKFCHHGDQPQSKFY